VVGGNVPEKLFPDDELCGLARVVVVLIAQPVSESGKGPVAGDFFCVARAGEEEREPEVESRPVDADGRVHVPGDGIQPWVPDCERLSKWL
jgi:hypothetical protein